MEKPVRTTDKLISIHFNSITDFMDHKLERSHPNYRDFENNIKEGKTHMEADRDLGPTNKCAADVVAHALLGDEQLGRIVGKCRDELDDVTGKRKISYRQSIKAVQRRRVKSDFGDELDIHKVYQGQLDKAWDRTERIVVDKVHSLVTVFIDVGGNFQIKCKDSLWRSAVASRLVAELEEAGKSVKVVVGSASSDTYKGDARRSTFSMVVKEYNQPLSQERLAAMSNIAFYRTVGFACKAVNKRTLHLNYGFSIPVKNNIPIQLQDELDAGHSRFVHIERACSLTEARRELDSVYAQMAEYSKGDAS